MVDEESDEILPSFAAMHVDEIDELLDELGLDLSDDALHQLALFIKQCGSLEAALAALHELESKAG